MRPRLVRLAQQFLGQAADAEEVAQEALALAWNRKVDQLEPARRNAWLFRVTINLSLNQRRRRKPSRQLDGEQAARLPSSASGAERDELLDRLRAAMDELRTGSVPPW